MHQLFPVGGHGHDLVAQQGEGDEARRQVGLDDERAVGIGDRRIVGAGQGDGDIRQRLAVRDIPDVAADDIAEGIGLPVGQGAGQQEEQGQKAV